MFVVLASFLACFSNTPSSGDSSGGDPTDPSQPWSESDTGTNEGSETDTGDTDTENTGEDTAQPPLVEVDVLVVGSGPAGLSAAWRARLEAELSSPLPERDIDRDSSPGEAVEVCLQLLADDAPGLRELSRTLIVAVAL